MSRLWALWATASAPTRYKLLGKGGVEPLGLELLNYSVFSDVQLLRKA